MKNKGTVFYLITLFLVLSHSSNSQNNNVLQVVENLGSGSENNSCGENNIPKFDLNRSSSVDTTFCNMWLNAEQKWVPRTIFVSTYDDFGRLEETITKFYIDSTQSYSPILRDTYTYYTSDSVESELNELWNSELDGGTWDNTSLDEYEYDEQNRLVYNLTYFSPYGSHDLNLGNQKFYTYNTQSLVDTIVTQYWNTNENAWFYSYRTRNYYDGIYLEESYKDWANNQGGNYLLYERQKNINEGDQKVRKITQNYSNEGWSNYYSELNSLNEMGLPDSILYQQWNPLDLMWDTTVMDLALFDYNEAGKLAEYITMSYYIMFVNNQRLAYYYDEENNVVELLSQQWDFNNNEWLNVNNCFYPPPPVITETGEELSEQNAFMLYPNPARDFTEVRFNDDQLLHPKISIYNTSGQLVHERMLEERNQINTSKIKPGLYFVRISANGQFHTAKLMIE